VRKETEKKKKKKKKKYEPVENIKRQEMQVTERFDALIESSAPPPPPTTTTSVIFE
jgi:hypothetical protein